MLVQILGKKNSLITLEDQGKEQDEKTILSLDQLFLESRGRLQDAIGILWTIYLLCR